MASQCGIRGYLDSGSYSRWGCSITRKYRKFRVGLGDGIGLRRPNDSANGEGRNRTGDTAIFRTEDDPTDRLAGLNEQMTWLREAGFAEVDCHFKWLELTLMVAVKEPAATA